MTVWIFFSVLAATPALAAEYETDTSRIRAVDGAEVLWENVHGRGERELQVGEPGRLPPPAVVGDSVVYGVGNQLYVVAAADGAVKTRVPLPAGVTAVRAEGDAVVVTVAQDSSGASWSRDYRVDPEEPEVPFFLWPGREALTLRLAARSVLSEALRDGEASGADGEDPAWRKSEEARPRLEAAVTELEALEDWDPTNPWYGFQRGLYLRDLGREDEARETFEAVLATDEAWSGELLGMALGLDAIDPMLGDRAFDRGLAYLVRRGYDPGMTSGLIGILLHYGQPSEGALRGSGRLEQLAERMWRLAPRAEGTPYFYAGVADALQAVGDADGASRWRERAYAGLPWTGFVPGGFGPERAGAAINALLAALLALLLVTFVKCLRYLPTQTRAGRSGWNPLSLWTRGEVLGTLVVLGLLLYSSGVVVRGLSALGRAAAMPLATVAGNYGHPAGLDYMSRLTDTPGGHFVRALALQKAGRLDEARALYEGLDDPRALNNLGVLHHAEGDAAGAAALFVRAADAAPGLDVAALNAGRQAEATARVETLRRYGAPEPLLALPSDAQWDEALADPVSPIRGLGLLFDSFQTIDVLASAATPAVARADVLDTGTIVTSLTLLLAGLAVLALFLRPAVEPVSTRLSRAGWGLGFLVPGTARQLSAAGPVLLWLAGYSWVVDRSLALSGGVGSNILTAIATPSFERAYGASSLILSPLEQAIRSTADWWWVLWIANLVLVLALERWRPDPCGPRGTAPE